VVAALRVAVAGDEARRVDQFADDRDGFAPLALPVPVSCLAMPFRVLREGAQSETCRDDHNDDADDPLHEQLLFRKERPQE
jgi:hypothetical protein